MDNLVTSSIGKKLMMALAGLFLIVFLVIHLSVNLLLLLNDGGAKFTVASDFMSTNFIIKIMEIVLFGGFIVHILYGVIVQIQNWIARPIRYVKINHSQTSFFSKYMIHTGAIIFAFLVIHFINFYFVKVGWVNVPAGVKDRHDFYNMAMILFKNPVYSWLYVILILFMGFHLHHSFQSAFQTIGWDHPKYTPIIKSVGLIYSIIITMGFVTIPIYILYFL
jgi:succinate dehydrogenase / fumarate reductase, cytochrome b subunit